MDGSNWDSLAVEYESLRAQQSILIPTRNEIINHIRPLAEKKQSLRILDIGCGTGQLLQELQNNFPQAELFGIDKSQQMCRFAQSKETTAKIYSLDIMQNEITRLIGTESIDIVICSHTMPYLPNKALAFQRMLEILNFNGKLLLVQNSIETIKDRLASKMLWSVSDKATYLSPKEFTLIASRYFEVDSEFLVRTNGFSPSVVGYVMTRKMK